MQYNTCQICGANGGRAGMLLGNPSKNKVFACENCDDTRNSGKIVIHTKLSRTPEELQKTFDILKTITD